MKKRNQPDTDFRKEYSWSEASAPQERYETTDGCTIVVLANNVPGLAKLFQRLNREFFADQLPNCTIQIGAIFSASRWEASVPYAHEGHADVQRQVITLGRNHFFFRKWSRKAHNEWIRVTLLHEMIHIQVALIHGEIGHGKHFRSELRRLGRLGEKWTADQIRYYRKI